MLKKRQKNDALWGVSFLFLNVYKISASVSNRNHFMFSMGGLVQNLTIQTINLLGYFNGFTTLPGMLHPICRNMMAMSQVLLTKNTKFLSWLQELPYLCSVGNKKLPTIIIIHQRQAAMKTAIMNIKDRASEMIRAAVLRFLNELMPYDYMRRC